LRRMACPTMLASPSKVFFHNLLLKTTALVPQAMSYVEVKLRPNTR